MNLSILFQDNIFFEPLIQYKSDELDMYIRILDLIIFH